MGSGVKTFFDKLQSAIDFAKKNKCSVYRGRHFIVSFF
jgi:hypothetical protein